MLAHVAEEVLLRPALEHAIGHLLDGPIAAGGHDGGLMAAGAQPAHLAHAKAGAHAHRALGQLVGELAPIDAGLHAAKHPRGPRRVAALAIAEHIKALLGQLLEELRAPALAIEHDGHAPLAHQRAHLGQDLGAQHRQQIVVGRGGDHEQRLGVLLVDPESVVAGMHKRRRATHASGSVWARP